MRTLETCSANPGLHPGESFERYQTVHKYCWEPQQSINFTEIDHLACIYLPKSFFYDHKLGKCSWPQRGKSAASTAKLVIHAKHGCAWRHRLLARSLQVCVFVCLDNHLCPLVRSHTLTFVCTVWYTVIGNTIMCSSPFTGTLAVNAGWSCVNALHRCVERCQCHKTQLICHTWNTEDSSLAVSVPRALALFQDMQSERSCDKYWKAEDHIALFSAHSRAATATTTHQFLHTAILSATYNAKCTKIKVDCLYRKLLFPFVSEAQRAKRSD